MAVGQELRAKAEAPRQAASTLPDAVRGVAAFVVAVGHSWQVFLYPLDKDSAIFNVLGSLAGWAVATFFVLSGMLIAMSIRRRSSGETFDLAAYLRARLIRIYPPLIVAVAVCLLAVGVIHLFGLYGSETYMLPGDEAAARERATISFGEVFGTLTLTYTIIPGQRFIFFDGPLWSLSYEVWLYVLAGLAATALANRARWAAIAAVVLLLWMLLGAGATPLRFWVAILVWWSGFAVGWYWERLSANRGRAFLLPMAGLVVAALAIANRDLLSFLSEPYFGLRQQLVYVLLSAAILCVIGVLVARFDHAPAFLERMGGYSYTLYLVHFPLLLLLCSLFRPLVLPYGYPGHLALAAVSLVATVAASAAMAHFVEDRPRMRRLTARLARLISPMAPRA